MNDDHTIGALAVIRKKRAEKQDYDG